MLIDTKNILGVGTGRIVVDNLNGTVTKVSYGALGVKQNQREFELSKQKDYVAVTELSGDYITQEKLTDIIIVPYKYKSTKRILKYLKKQVPDYDFSLIIKHRLHNRVQIGKDNKGVYKYFDYEDVKYYENNNRSCR